MGRSKSSQQWLRKHFDDEYVKRAQREGYRSRGVEFLQGDFREDDVLNALNELLGDATVNLVMSDMAPNISGMDAVDQPRSMYLVELAADFAASVLGKGGDLLFKGFQGEGFDSLLKDLRGQYRKVLIRKPKASRPRSREVYVLAKGRINVNVS